MADSQAYLHGKTYAIFGDPDFVYGMARFVLETGGEPRHCLATNGNTAWEEQMRGTVRHPRRSVRNARCGAARICGTCVRCWPPSRWTC